MRDSRTTGLVATTLGAVALLSVASLVLLFVAQGPFGTINDVGNAAIGILSAVLAVALGAGRRPGPGVGFLVIGATVVGAVLTIAGSALVVSGTSGFFFAGLVSSVGFAFIGLWLIVLSQSAGESAQWPRGLRTLGLVAGAMMALGFVSAIGIVMGLDNIDTAPGWIWIGSIGWLGTYLLFPAWSLWLGRLADSLPEETARIRG